MKGLGILEFNFMPLERVLWLLDSAFELESAPEDWKTCGEFSTLVGAASLLSPTPSHIGCHFCIKYKNQRENYCALRIVSFTTLGKKKLIPSFFTSPELQESVAEKQNPLFSEEGFLFFSQERPRYGAGGFVMCVQWSSDVELTISVHMSLISMCSRILLV